MPADIANDGESLPKFLASALTGKSDSRLASPNAVLRGPHDAQRNWGICVSLILMIFIIGIATISQLRISAVANSQRELTNLGVVLAEQTARGIQSVDVVLKMSKRHIDGLGPRSPREFRSLLADGSVHEYLLGHLRNLPQARIIFLVDANGRLVNWSESKPIPDTDFSDRDYFRALRDGATPDAFISSVMKGRLTGRWITVIARRINAPDGTFLGLVAGLIETQFFEDFYATISMVPGESVTLLRRNGEVIAGHPDIEGQRGRRVPEKSPWYDRVASGGGTYRSPGFLSDVPKIVTVHPLRDYPLVVDVDMSEQAALGNWYAEAVGILAAMITVSTGIIILFAMISAQFRRQEASERRLKAYAEMAADWFWVQDPDHRYMTEASATVTTHSTEVGKTRWDLADPAMDPERWVQHKKDLEARRPFRDFRWESIDRNGQRHYLSSNGDPVFDKSGTFLGYQGTGRDITAEVVASARALQADMLLKDAVNCMSEGFVIFDGDDKLVMCNDAYRRICGDSVRLLPGVSYEQILWQCAPDNAHYSDDEKASVIAKLISAHRAAEESFEYRLTDGSTILATDRRMSSGGIAGLRINITDLKRTQEALRESESRLDRAQEIAGLGSWELDVTNGRYAWSKENYRIRGLPPDFEPTEENTFAGIHPDDIRLTSEWLADLKAGRERGPIEKRFTLPDGQVRVLRSEGLAIVDPDGIIRRVAGTTQDVTERRTIEKQLAQSQKMEAIGTLTGGMAHDFNNGLGVIIGNLDLLARRITADELATELCREAVLGATRCAELIRRLLAFARRQSLRPETTELNALVTETTHMLRHTLGENVTIKLDLADEVWKVTVDPVQLEAALVNLATNARDAMPKGGRIEIRTRNVEIDEAYQAQEPDIRPGAFALIEVSDTGIGMPPEIMGRIFEPFFTTKGQGAGTGLGLAMTFGFVKQSGGHISVYSEPGLGSSFRIYLPREEAERPVATDLPEASEIIGGDETILLVEDNAQLLRVASRQLLGLGYRVHEAEDAAAALAIMERGDTPDLLFTDVVMPGKMDGLDLAYEALRQLPNIRILLASGFPGVRGGDDRLTDSPFTLLNKPYRRDAMARAVRRVLDGDKVVMKTARRSDRLPETQPG